MQGAFIEFMKEEKRRGKTILLSSHIFSEVDAICDTIAIIKDGRIVSTVKADDIRHNQNKMFHITFSSADQVNQFRNRAKIAVSYCDPERHIAEVGIHDSEVNLLIAELANYHVESFREIKYTLESYFMRFYETAPESGVKTYERSYKDTKSDKRLWTRQGSVQYQPRHSRR
jgi:ABC-2 type transport system ATP-binding protein